MKLLTSDQKSFYHENGFIQLDNIFTPSEMEEISSAYNELFHRKNHEKSNLKALWQGHWQSQFQIKDDQVHVQSIHNLQMHNAVFTKLLMNKNLLDAIEDIMDTENIILHHTKAHLKPPGHGAPFPMHQDYHYFPYEKHSMLAIFLHLDDTTPENGGLAVIPKSHKLGPLPDFSDSKGFHYVDQDKFKIDQATPVSAKKGDVVIFSYLLVHGSYVNTSERQRRMFLIQLASADDVPKADIHKSPCNGMLLRGVNVGQDADINKRHEKSNNEEPKF